MNPFRLQVKLNKHRLKAKPIMSSSSSSQSQPLLTSQPGAPNTYTAPLEAADQVSNGSTYKKAYITTRRHIETFLASRAQHWIVLTLVSLDLLGIFADIIINLYQCDEGKEDDPKWNAVRNGLGIAGLVFSCLFMLELLLSLWAFGWLCASPIPFSFPNRNKPTSGPEQHIDTLPAISNPTSTPSTQLSSSPASRPTFCSTAY